MAFEPITFENGVTPITAQTIRHVETQYDKAAAYISTVVRQSNTSELRAEVRSSAPSGAQGRFYFNTANGKMQGSDGTSWGDW